MTAFEKGKDFIGHTFYVEKTKIYALFNKVKGKSLLYTGITYSPSRGVSIMDNCQIKTDEVFEKIDQMIEIDREEFDEVYREAEAFLNDYKEFFKNIKLMKEVYFNDETRKIDGKDVRFFVSVENGDSLLVDLQTERMIRFVDVLNEDKNIAFMQLRTYNQLETYHFVTSTKYKVSNKIEADFNKWFKRIDELKKRN